MHNEEELEEIPKPDIETFREGLISGSYNISVGKLSDGFLYEARLRDGASLPIVSLVHKHRPPAIKVGVDLEFSDGGSFSWDYDIPPPGLSRLVDLLDTHAAPKKLELEKDIERAREEEEREYFSPQEVNIDAFNETLHRHTQHYNSAIRGLKSAGWFDKTRERYVIEELAMKTWKEHLITPLVEDMRSSRFEKVDRGAIDAIANHIETAPEFSIHSVLQYVARQIGIEYQEVDSD
tara:strand:- start:569 stop:1276 length:708 start_codon:yes stop_codon:yes gene_type:complete